MASNIRVKAGARRAGARRGTTQAAGEAQAPQAETENAPAAAGQAPAPKPSRPVPPVRANKRSAASDAAESDGGDEGGRISRMDKLRQADRKLKQAEMLLNVSRRVAAIESLDEVLETMVEMTTWELQAERGTLFLNDPVTDELYSRFAQGNFQREIRIMNNSGIAGAVFQSGEGLIILDAYSDDRFNRTVDEQTGFVTKSILCAPVKTVKGDLIGVIQMLNKKKGEFTDDDLALLEAMTTQASVALQSTQFVEKMKKSREQELEFLDIVTDVTSDLELGSLLAKVMTEATRMLSADRGTLFINDEKTNELFSRVAMGESIGEIRLPNTAGIAGAVFTSGKSVNIPYAYADLRFNPAFDKQTGYFTRSMLAIPVTNKDGKVIGVTQVLNKRGGPFSDEDEARLKAFTSQIAIALENAKLFEDVQNMKNYNESMLESMTNAVVTLDEDGKIVTCNAAGLRILRIKAADIIDKVAEEVFVDENAWLMEQAAEVDESGEGDIKMDAEIVVGDGEVEKREKINCNVTCLPLLSPEDKKLGVMFMIEDISSEKRMKSTMSRYMDPGLADQLMAGGDDALGGRSLEATVLFSDVRSFTTITESLGPQGTVQMLNEYFTIMVECISREGGMLDKFIGDAIMAGFGVPLPHDDDEDRAVRAGISMIRELWEWNKEREAKGEMPIDMGLGLNTDNVVTGNIGSPKRMDYTMIGDGVNLAARLESACKQYAARILISDLTYKKLKGTYRIRDIDRVIVKGKTKPVEIYEVLDYHSEETFPNLMEVVNNFKGARGHYNNGDWDKAMALFNECLKANPSDKLAQIYIERCEALKAEPPEDWDGVFVMTSK
ncbi:MAG: GAF domain-containing protein [Rhodospirillales bacterium]|nr:GAF domain-containing protein [Rhodospirillales bacterium]MBO6786107.1 GAF domain-containing protein [Rhodospirillales bacterium]